MFYLEVFIEGKKRKFHPQNKHFLNNLSSSLDTSGDMIQALKLGQIEKAGDRPATPKKSIGLCLPGKISIFS
ncbi:MAG: hypothetical protein ONA69_00905 [candidate division KSB1 bacterium]|nr:hypothetical protein [candidate division KSB1 bacterium]MDZ7345332.1 hypothetical protein [candidate division KSB1 bacterium]